MDLEHSESQLDLRAFSGRLFCCLSIQLSTFIYLPICPSVYQSIYLRMTPRETLRPVDLSIFIYLPIYLSIHLSVHSSSLVAPRDHAGDSLI